jgi:hypothetical protein
LGSSNRSTPPSKRYSAVREGCGMNRFAAGEMDHPHPIGPLVIWRASHLGDIKSVNRFRFRVA